MTRAEPHQQALPGTGMKIVQASLCLRFYTDDGWTRESVRALLCEDKRLARVIPRYFDERDKVGQGSFELDDGLPHDECDYFAVYGHSSRFDPDEIAKHTIDHWFPSGGASPWTGEPDDGF